jgi:hypothetical protein
MLPGFASKLRSRCSSGSSQSCGQFDKHFTIVTYGPSKINCVLSIVLTLQCIVFKMHYYILIRL